MWVPLVHPPARQLEIAFRLVENRPDVINAYSRRAKFLENCVRVFGDETRQCCLATAEAGSQSALPTARAWGVNDAHLPRWTP
jgi:hypothetical protein